jgi:vacuolar-type H+-ATPase subunit F/Vma7
MHTVAYLGNALDAAGWRLAGALTFAPAAGEAVAALAAARQAAALVLLDSETASALPPDVLEPALVALQPLVLVLPDAGDAPPPPFDPAERVRRQLGLEAAALPEDPR